MTRALVTRPEEDAESLAAALRARGIAPVIEPILHVEPEAGESLDLDGVQAILFTSTNAVREFAKRVTRRDLPVYAVGDATARAAKAAGFATVTSAARDAETLAKLVAGALKPASGALLHPRGRDTTGHLESALHAAGFELRSPVIYRAEAARALTPDLRKMLQDGAIDFALFFSPRTARGFAKLAQDAGLAEAMRNMTAVTLSQAVADALRPLAFRDVAVASAPNQEALLAALPAAPAARPRRGWIYAALAAGALIAIAAGVFVAQRREAAPPPRPAVQAELQAPAPAPAPAPAQAPSDPRVAPLEQRVAPLEQEVGQLRARLQAISGAQGSAAAAQSQRVQTLEDRIAALEAQRGRESSGGAELLIAAGQLRDAINRGAPYASSLDAVAALGKGDPDVQSAVATLQPKARTGIPIQPQLVQRFEPLAAGIVQAAIAPEGSHWTDRLLARLASLVNIRRVGADVQGSDPDAIVARAEAHVKSGDLAGAVAELDTLQGPPAEAGRIWLADAKARLAADQALDSLGANALRRLGARRAE